MDSKSESQYAVAKDVYLNYRDHRTGGNWLFSEPTWENLGDDDQKWWKDFVTIIIKKVKQESLSIAAGEKKIH